MLWFPSRYKKGSGYFINNVHTQFIKQKEVEKLDNLDGDTDFKARTLTIPFSHPIMVLLTIASFYNLRPITNSWCKEFV